MIESRTSSLLQVSNSAAKDCESLLNANDPPWPLKTNNPFLVNPRPYGIRDVHGIGSIAEFLIFTFQFIIFLGEKSIVTMFGEFRGDAPFSMLELQHRDLEYGFLNLSEYSLFDCKFDRISDAMIPRSTVRGARRNDRDTEFDERLFEFFSSLYLSVR